MQNNIIDKDQVDDNMINKLDKDIFEEPKQQTSVVAYIYDVDEQIFKIPDAYLPDPTQHLVIIPLDIWYLISQYYHNRISRTVTIAPNPGEVWAAKLYPLDRKVYVVWYYNDKHDLYAEYLLRTAAGETLNEEDFRSDDNDISKDETSANKMIWTSPYL